MILIIKTQNWIPGGLCVRMSTEMPLRPGLCIAVAVRSASLYLRSCSAQLQFFRNRQQDKFLDIYLETYCTYITIRCDFLCPWCSDICLNAVTALQELLPGTGHWSSHGVLSYKQLIANLGITSITALSWSIWPLYLNVPRISFTLQARCLGNTWDSIQNSHRDTGRHCKDQVK